MRVYIERRAPTRSLSQDVARHLLTRALPPSPILIVCENPQTFLPILRKQWSNLLRQVSTEQSRTLRASRLRELATLHIRMEAMRFRLGTAPDVSRADIRIKKPSELVNGPAAEFHTAYVLESLNGSGLSRLLELLDYHGLVVLYDRGGGPYADVET